MIPVTLPSPVEFFWNALGRHLIADPCGDVQRDVATALSRTYQHASSDRERLFAKLRDVRTGRSKDTLEKWAKDMAKYRVGHEVAAEGAGGCPDAEALAALVRACSEAAKVSDTMRGVRLTTAMLAVAREDAPSILVASIRPAAPEALDFRPCGQRPYREHLREILTTPPSGPFVLVEFGKQTMAPEDLILQLSPRMIRTPAGTIDRARVLAALPLVEGIEWRTVDELARLSDARERDVARIVEIDARIDRIADALAVDVYDLLDALPQHGSASWNALRVLADEAEPQDEE